jgi:hypothetical protein
MCNKKTCEISYSMIYNDAFKSGNKDVWLKGAVQKTKFFCPRKRYLTLQHISKAISSQRIFKSIDVQSSVLVRREFKIAKKERLSLLKRIQKHTLQHMYKPNGKMFWRNFVHLNEL